jgi:metallophosphoesterase (TIGR00282 family)
MKQSVIKILFIGDIVGRPGRKAVAHFVPLLRKSEGIDLVIANGENMAAGRGFTHEKYEDLLKIGVDYFTSGNHIWANANIIPYLKNKSVKILRPANFTGENPGLGFDTVEVDGVKVTIINLIGQVFNPIPSDNPFHAVDEIVSANKDSVIVVDLHAEATSEKVAMGHYLDGRVSVFCGTHTHIQTADERILPKGTAYITDAGMCGPKESVLGVKKEIIIDKFLTAMPQSHKVAVGDMIFNALLIEVDTKTKKAIQLKRINETLLTDI